MATDEVNYTAKDDRENSGSVTSETNPIWNDRYSGDVSLSAAKYDVLNKIFRAGIYNSTRVARKHSEAQTRDVNYDDRILVLKQGLDLPGRNELEQEEYIYALVNEEAGENPEIDLVMRISENRDGHALHTVDQEYELLFDRQEADVTIFDEGDVNELLEASRDPVDSKVRERSSI